MGGEASFMGTILHSSEILLFLFLLYIALAVCKEHFHFIHLHVIYFA